MCDFKNTAGLKSTNLLKLTAVLCHTLSPSLLRRGRLDWSRSASRHPL